MILTPSQIVVLKALVAAEPTLATAVSTGQDNVIAAWLDAPAVPDYFVWRSVTPTAEILDAIQWSNLTPVDIADGTATFTNRALACQAKQLNLQILLQGREILATGKSTVRQGLQDALTGVPAGSAGALLDAGWLGANKVKASITRKSSRAEKATTTGVGTQGTPAPLAFEGDVSISDAGLLR